ncbi:MAG TPA: PLP-dependent aminotransferase family protein [Candidatus Dormibacteraeota bacterium]|nr:PLP-dependent aminotransferase family protein [Candidatus Dormibacteraeota bacterium]
MSNPPLAKRAAGITGSAVDSSVSMLERHGGRVISFGMGAAGPDAIPGGPLGELASQIFADASNSALNYGPTEGERVLRSALIKSLPSWGQPATEESLLITTGAMQGLDLVCKMYLDPHDVVITESPTYPNALVSIASYEGRVVECPTDEHGIVVDAIGDAVKRAGRAPKLIYVIPNHQNPTGVTLTDERRRHLIEVARSYGAVILEDDPYGRLSYDGASNPTLFELDHGEGTVVSVNTFSKVVAPGLRVGWVVGSPDLIARMVAARHGMDTCTNVLGQRLIAAFMEDQGLDEHIVELRERYGRKLGVMLAALEHNFAAQPGVEWTRPTGGFFVWLRLPGIVADELVQVALANGVFFIPGSAFTTTEDFRDCVRINFTFPSEREIIDGVATLNRVYTQQRTRRPVGA